MVLPTAALLLVAAASPAKMGHIDFKVTGSPQCQKSFVEGMLALHSFMYEEARDSFQAAGPDCAMARWGEAMTYSHPLWGEEEPKKARESLAKIGTTEKLTAKERAWIGAGRALFGEGEKYTRHAAWLDAMAHMHSEYPADDEVALEHALALMANSDFFRNVRRLMEAAAISAEVLERKPQHPGAAHYLIHACDSPDHAILALPAARKYARIAPAASHALHMPSHIFVQLGMWSDAAASNEAAWAADKLRAAKRHETLEEWDLHSYSWLAAAYSELGQAKRADALLADLASWLEKEDGAEARFAYSVMARQLLRNSGRWDRAEALLAPLSKPLPLEKGEPAGSLGCAMHAPGAEGKTRPPFGLFAQLRALYIRAEAAMRAGDEAGVRKQIDAMHALEPAFEPWKRMMPKDAQDRWSHEILALLAGARAKAERTPQRWDEAIEAFRRSAAMGEGSAPAGPAFDPPARELLAEAELAAGRPKEALADFDLVLEKHPMLSRSLLGAARAAKAAGDGAGARERYAQLARLWSHADEDLKDLPEARAAGELATAK